MFDIGLQEMIVIGVIALVVFGPDKLPELGRRLGRAMREFRRASDEFRTTVETNLKLNEPDPPSEPPVELAPLETAAPSPAPPSETDPYATAEVPVATAEAPAEPFCAQRGSRLFHKTDCQWVARIPEIERTWFKSVSDARDQGFVTCPVCEPWEPGG
jgi:TatA/E family protein of Tat protein translocase